MLEKSVRILSYITLFLLVLISNEALASTPDTGVTGESCVVTYSGIQYATFNGYDIVPSMSSGSNNFAPYNHELYFRPATSSSWTYLMGGTDSFDNRSAPSRSPDGCTHNPSFPGGFYTSLSTTTQGIYSAVIFGENITATTSFYWLSSGGTISPIGNPLGDFEAGYNINFATQYQTRFTNLVYSTTTSTTTLTVGFYIDPDEATSTQADKNPTIVRYRYSKVPSTDVLGYGVPITGSVSPTWGNATTSATFNLDPNSTYDFTISFANGGTVLTGVSPFPSAYIYLRLSTNATGGIASTSTVEFYNALEEQAFEYQPCSITDIGGCITNAFTYLFVPSNASMNQFATLRTEMENRSPFVYAFQLPTYWDMLYETNQTQSLTVSASTSIGTITFISEAQLEAIPLSNTVRTIIGYLLWIMLAFMLYHRVTNIFNHQDKVV